MLWEDGTGANLYPPGEGRGGEGVDSHMKEAGVLIVLLRCVNEV